MGDTVDALTSKADVGQRVKDNVADKRDRVMEQMQGTASRVGEATPDASDVGAGVRQAAGVAQRNPIGLALGGVAAGFLAGMALPSTRIEDERIGPVSDEITDRAREAGQEAIERGQQVAHDVADAAGESVQQVADTARESATEVADTARNSTQEQVQQ
jgi:hypothetical protein